MPTAERDAEKKKACSPAVYILGIAQDGGVPHIGTPFPARGNPLPRRGAACLGIADPVSGERWLVDATPDIKDQLAMFDKGLAAVPEFSLPSPPAGILLTHAHVGHYLGLAWLGREMWSTRALPVYAMPRMAAFLSGNLPWSDLVRRENISLRSLQGNVPLTLNERITVVPLPVPHRDEYSETVGFRIVGPERSLLYIPDIDRWEDWDAQGVRVEERIAMVDRALLDGTFFSGAELPGRDMTKIPHPAVAGSLERFGALPERERQKIRFIHLNHSNPLLDPDSRERRLVEEAGFGVAEEGEVIPL